MVPPRLPIRLLYRTLQRLLTLDVTWLMTLSGDAAKDIDSRHADGELIVRLLTPADVELASRRDEYEMPAELADRLQSELDYCVGAFVDGELASYAWYALDSVEAAHNRGAAAASGVAFSFARDIAFMYKGFTHSRFRGRGLYRQVQRFALDTLGRRGVHTILSTADWTNAAALTSCTRLGFEPLGRVWVVGIGAWVWRKIPAGAKDQGIQGGPAARVTERSVPAIC